MNRKAALFIRVSSKEQEEEGYSMQAQEKSSTEFVRRHNLDVVRTWSVAETAKSADLRKAFKEFVQFVRSTPTVTVMLFEKPDRMTRNFSDLVTIYELIEKHGKELHFFKTGLKIDRNSKSSEQIQLDIQVVLARNFVNNLREEVLKGMRMKVRNGGFPAIAPVGYINNTANASIEIDPVQAPLIKRVFEAYATGRYTVAALARVARKLGLKSRHESKSISPSWLYSVLRNTLYYGLVSWGGEQAMGTHEPIITQYLFERVQTVLGNERRAIKCNYPFQGLALCACCGSVVTSERHATRQSNGVQRTYMYYRCSGWRNARSVCKGAYIREEALVLQIGEWLKDFQIDEDLIPEIHEQLKRGYAADASFTQDRTSALRGEETRLKNRIDQAYNDKLDGVISADEYRDKAAAWRNRLCSISDELQGVGTPPEENLQKAGRIIDLGRRAYSLFQEQPDNFERRKLIDLVVSKVTLRDKRVVLKLREPFESLSKLASVARSGRSITGWYARQELNL